MTGQQTLALLRWLAAGTPPDRVAALLGASLDEVAALLGEERRAAHLPDAPLAQVAAVALRRRQG